MKSAIHLLNTVTFVPDVSSATRFERFSFGIEGVGKSFSGCTAKQVHGTTLVEAKNARAWNSDVEADGVWSETPGLSIAVKTADCLPVLLATSDGAMVMALHAGWRGLCAGIIREGVCLIRQRHPDADICALLGPSISGAVYEVGPDVLEAVTSSALGLDASEVGFCLRKGRQDRWYFDLASAAVFALHHQSVSAKNISAIHSCTFSHPTLWHSFRRDREKMGSNYTWIHVREI